MDALSPVYLYENPIWIACSRRPIVEIGADSGRLTGKNLRPLAGKGACGA